MKSRSMRRTALGFFLIFSATAAVLGFGIKEIVIFSIVGSGIFYATMQMIDRPPT